MHVHVALVAVVLGTLHVSLAQLLPTTPFTHTWDNIQAGFFTDFGANDMLDAVSPSIMMQAHR